MFHRMYLRSLFIALCLTLSIPASLSRAEPCTCLWQGAFYRAAPKADLIVSGTITANKGNSADLQIAQILKGKEYRETIRLWGDEGTQCRPNIDNFPAQTQWLLALYKIKETPATGFNPNTPNISYGRIDDYFLSQCGAYWLKLQEGFVSGNLVNGSRWQWDNKTMNPVLLELVDAYLKGLLPDRALVEAAKPQTASKKLMNETKQFLRFQ